MCGSRETVSRKQLVLGSDTRELIHLPGGSVVVIDQAKERLLLSTQMTVEGPCENSLRADHEREMRIHPASARRSIVASAAGSKLIEPDGCRQISFDRHGAKDAADRITRIEAFGPKGHIRFISTEIVEASPP